MTTQEAKDQLSLLPAAIRAIAEKYFPEWETFKGIDTDSDITVLVLRDYCLALGGNGHLVLRDRGYGDLHWYDTDNRYLLDASQSPRFIKQLTSECCLKKDLTVAENLTCWDVDGKMKA